MKNYRVISHNVTTHMVKKWPHTAEAPTLAQNELKPDGFHLLQPQASAAGLKLTFEMRRVLLAPSAQQ